MAETDYRLQLILEAQDDMSEKIKAVKKQIEDMEKSVDDANKKVKQAGSSSVSVLNSIKGAIAKIGITAAIMKTTASIVELADNLEQAKIAFTTMLGSAEDAEIMLNQLTEFAKKTPFELTGIRESARQLLAMGVQASDMIPTLKALGDTSAALSVPLERLAYNYGQVVSQGRLTGKELKDFTAAGVPLLDELSQMLGVSTSQIQDMASKGQISADIMVEAFKHMTDEGGRFANLMEKQATTLSGLWSNFQDTLASIGEEVGTELIPTLKGYVDQMGERTSDNKDNIVSVCKEIFATVKTVADNIIEAVKEVRDSVQGMLSTFSDIFYEVFGAISNSNTETTTGMAKDRTDFFYILKAGLVTAVQLVKTFTITITSYFTALVKTIRLVVVNISSMFGALRDDIKNGALNMASSAVNAVVKLVNGIIDKINRLADGIKELTGLDLTIGKVSEVDFGGGYAGTLGDKLSAMGDEISGYFSDATSSTVEAFNSGMDAVVDVYANRVAEVTNRGAQLIKQSGGEIKKQYKETFGGMDEDGKSGKDKSAEKYKKEIKSMDDFMHNHLDKQKKLINDLNNEYQKKFDEIGNKIKDTEKNIEGLNEKISDLKKQMSDLKIDENKSLAKEVVNAKKELKSLEEQYEGLKEVANSVSREDLQNVGGIGKFDKDLINKYKDYQDELNSVYSGMSEQEKAALDQEIAYAEWYDSLNGIEKIKEDYRVRQEEIQNELNSKLIALQQEQDTLRMYKKEQDKLQTEWIKRIDEERQKYEGMYNALKQYEEQYMEQIEEDHNKQIEMTEKLIDHRNEVYRAKMRAMSAGSDGSRASGGPVYQGNQYLVGEKGPELFVPNTNGKIVKTSDLENSGNQNITLNVNLGSVNVSNESDQENLINTISQGILRKLELYRKGIRV